MFSSHLLGLLHTSDNYKDHCIKFKFFPFFSCIMSFMHCTQLLPPALSFCICSCDTTVWSCKQPCMKGKYDASLDHIVPHFSGSFHCERVFNHLDSISSMVWVFTISLWLIPTLCLIAKRCLSDSYTVC